MEDTECINSTEAKALCDAGDRSAKRGSAVAYGSLRGTLCGLAPSGRDVDSLTP